jgi:hypothetical protein
MHNDVRTNKKIQSANALVCDGCLLVAHKPIAARNPGRRTSEGGYGYMFVAVPKRKYRERRMPPERVPWRSKFFEGGNAKS